MSNKPSLLAIIQSVIASAFGVQTQQKYQHDFNRGSLLGYLVVAIIFFVFLILSLVFLVNWILST
jgi:uncharacterized membrane protein